MNQVQARKTVLVSIFLLAAIAVYRDHKAGAGDTFKALWGVGVVGLLLSLLADFAPTIAGPFAALVVLGSLTEKGNNVISASLSRISLPAANPNTSTTGLPSHPTTTSGGTTSTGSSNPARPTSPPGTTPAGGTR